MSIKIGMMVKHKKQSLLSLRFNLSLFLSYICISSEIYELLSARHYGLSTLVGIKVPTGRYV